MPTKRNYKYLLLNDFYTAIISSPTTLTLKQSHLLLTYNCLRIGLKFSTRKGRGSIFFRLETVVKQNMKYNYSKNFKFKPGYTDADTSY